MNPLTLDEASEHLHQAIFDLYLALHGFTAAHDLATATDGTADRKLIETSLNLLNAAEHEDDNRLRVKLIRASARHLRCALGMEDDA